MTTIFVLFNLKQGADRVEYEAWAKSTDIPVVNRLASVASFDVNRASRLLMGEGTPPFEYLEVIRVADMERFGAEIGTKSMQGIAERFQSFAEKPIFIVTETV